MSGPSPFLDNSFGPDTHHCIIIGTRLHARIPYTFAINGPKGDQLETIMSHEEYDVIIGVLARMGIKPEVAKKTS